MERINLFCLPFAGGSKFSYRKLEARLPPFLRGIPLDYPGRGRRTHEPPLDDLDALVDDLYGGIRGRLAGAPYALYGHSLGGLVAWQLARKILRQEHPPPLHVFVTGTPGPAAPSRTGQQTHRLSRAALFEAVRKYEGSTPAALQDEELLDVLEPILRADFRVSDAYVYRPGRPLDVPLTVITGTEEDLAPEEIRLWQRETRRPADFRQMPGNHFFIFDHPAEVAALFSATLAASRPGANHSQPT